MFLDRDLINCFQSFIWKPSEGFSATECYDLCEKLDFANQATTRFLQGEIDEDEFLAIKEWAHDGEVDEFIESAEANLKMFLPSLA